jgi:hypothetical protein
MPKVTAGHHKAAETLFGDKTKLAEVRNLLQEQYFVESNNLPHVLTKSQASNVCTHTRRRLGIRKRRLMATEVMALEDQQALNAEKKAAKKEAAK